MSRAAALVSAFRGGEVPFKVMKSYVSGTVEPPPSSEVGVEPLASAQTLLSRVGTSGNFTDIYDTRVADGTYQTNIVASNFQVHRVRFDGGGDHPPSLLNQLHAATGVKWGLIFPNAKGFAAGTNTISNATIIGFLAQLTPGSVAYVSGANEWNINVSGGGYTKATGATEDWWVDARAHQLDLYTRITTHTTQWIRELLVLSFSLANPYEKIAVTPPNDVDRCGDLRDRCHIIDTHGYFAGGEAGGTGNYTKGPSGGAYNAVLNRYRILNPGMRIAVTETGNNTAASTGVPGTHPLPVTLDVMKRHAPEGVAWWLQSGAPFVLLYQFYNDPGRTSEPERHFGQITSDNVRKPQFEAVSRFLALLKDVGGQNAPLLKLDYTISNRAPSGGKSEFGNVTEILTVKQDGTHILIVWRGGLKYWDYGQYAYTARADTSHTLTIPVARAATVYRPSEQTGTSLTNVPTQTLAASTTHTFPLGMGISVVVLAPAPRAIEEPLVSGSPPAQHIQPSA